MSDFKRQMEEIRKEESKLKKRKREVLIECGHKNKKGNLDIVPMGNKGDFLCPKCNQEFNMQTISKAELKAAIDVIYNASQQIRCYTTGDSPEAQNTIRALGKTIYNLEELSELYDRTIKAYAKKGKKGKKNSDSEYGDYSSGKISFMGR